MSTPDLDLDISRYKIISKIGEGGFSIVYRVKDITTGFFYAAKVSNFMIDEDTKDSQESIILFREVNLLSVLDHPCILKFIGYFQTNFEKDPVPTIITELATNGSLRDIIELENSGLSPKNWDNTKKLINIYGIACGMSYLHSHNVIHRDLKLDNILVDDYLHPKISDFGLSKILDFLSISLNVQSQKGLKGTPLYMAPEILTDEKYSKAGDVYAFAYIVYELMTGEIPFKNFTNLQLMKKVVNQGTRPEFKDDIPDCYRELIESCWSQIPEERPSFETIVETLKTTDDFITDGIDDSEFYDYVDYIDECQTTFDFSKHRIRFEDFIKTHKKEKEANPSQLKEDQSKGENVLKSSNNNENEDDDSDNDNNNIDSDNDSDTNNSNDDSDNDNDNNNNDRDVDSDNSNENSDNDDSGDDPKKSAKLNNIYPISEFNSLNKACQKMVEEAANDAEKQFAVGESLIEGKNNFPKNVELGLKYIEESNKKMFIKSIVYYATMLVKGDIIPQDLNKANEYLSKIDPAKDSNIIFLKGQISRKSERYTEASKYYEEGSKANNIYCLYKYGKMLFLGQGIKRNAKEALIYINKSKDQGFKKSEIFLIAFNELNKVSGFSKLPAETQLFIIKNNIKNPGFNNIVFQSSVTEKLFFNKSLKSPVFYKCLNKYKDVSFEMEHPSKSFKSISDLIIKIQSKKCKNIKITIVLSSFSEPLPKICFSNNILYYRIDSSINAIPSEIFTGCSTLTQIVIPSSVTLIENNALKDCSSLKQITIPSSVSSIGSYTFSGCSSLAQITIPSSITSIKDNAFEKCIKLEQITIPSSVTSIGNSAFRECSSLKQIEIPSSLSTIAEFLFCDCTSMTKITIPFSVKSIGSFAFKKCSSLAHIEIPSSVTSIDRNAFEKCSSLIEISIPASIQSIEKGLFGDCSSLKTISLPSSITSIDSYAFYQCSSLTHIEIPNTINSINNWVFYYCTSLAQIKIPSSVITIGKNCFICCKSLTEIVIPSGVTSIGDHAFESCSSLVQITIPPTVSSIGEGAFERCRKLVQIKIPNSVTLIKDRTFYDCDSLTEITIPSSVTTIGNRVFGGCSSLEQIIIPSSVTSIGYDAFLYCPDDIKITIPSALNGKLNQNNLRQINAQINFI